MIAVRRLLITPGEPAGIGPDITLALLQHSFPIEIVVIADPDLLKQRASQLGLSLTFIECNVDEAPLDASEAGVVRILPVKLRAPVVAQELNPANAAYVLETLQLATTLCLTKAASGIVTGPVHKEIMNKAGIAFTGHTEFFAKASHVDHTVMLFVVNELKVALVTTHIPLKAVSAAITKERLRLTLSLLHQALKQQFHIANPRLLVCGLNPHAGEGGYLGREEIDTIAPLLETLRNEHYTIEGPLPADTIFTQEILKRADAVVAMYHDQGLPLVKYIGFGHAVNMTLGLPFVRTSVDHGTALDLAGSGKADAGSMMKALELAIALAPPLLAD